jgi:hypothetical protein
VSASPGKSAPTTDVVSADEEQVVMIERESEAGFSVKMSAGDGSEYAGEAGRQDESESEGGGDSEGGTADVDMDVDEESASDEDEDVEFWDEDYDSETDVDDTDE